MGASRINYLVYYPGESQIYGSASKEIALKTAPPNGFTLEDKRVGFITFEPDNGTLTFHPLPSEEILNAEIELPKKKEPKEDV